MNNANTAPPFTYRVSVGWLRDLATEPTPGEAWPSIRWDDRLFADQVRFLDAQAEYRRPEGVDAQAVWGFFVDRAWPVDFTQILSAERERYLNRFVEAAKERGIRVLSGVGVYSWGFEEIIRRHPEVGRGDSRNMCPFQPAAWDWQRRVLDFLLEPRWNLDGISMQSADLGRCLCEECQARSAAEHHADVLTRCAEYVRAARPDWIIGQAAWGLKVDAPDDLRQMRRIGSAVDYMIEVQEGSARAGRRAEIVSALDCAFGSVGGVFTEPPQHKARLTWCLPHGLMSARCLAALYADGGRACEYFYRVFADPVEEVSWRTGARILAAPDTAPEAALREAIERVYGVTGPTSDALTDWFIRAEDAYFSRSSFAAGDGPLSLEPLIWKEDPTMAGPPVYLTQRMTGEQRDAYRAEMTALRDELSRFPTAAFAAPAARRDTLTGLDGLLLELDRLKVNQP